MKTSKAEGPVKVFRILLVDDNRNGLLARKSVLEEHGYQVDAFSSPQDALAEFGEQSDGRADEQDECEPGPPQ